MVRKCSIITLLLCVLLLIPQASFAEKKLRITHRQLSVEHLPNPGIPVDLNVRLLNTQSLDYKLRTHIEIDGRNLSVPSQMPTRDEYDRPTYKIPIFSPLAGMSYFFTLETSDGKVIKSKNYSTQRTCIPPVSPVSDKVDASTEAKANLQMKIVRVQKLESEIKQLEQAMILADYLKHSLIQGGSQ